MFWLRICSLSQESDRVKRSQANPYFPLRSFCGLQRGQPDQLGWTTRRDGAQLANVVAPKMIVTQKQFPLSFITTQGHYHWWTFETLPLRASLLYEQDIICWFLKELDDPTSSHQTAESVAEFSVYQCFNDGAGRGCGAVLINSTVHSMEMINAFGSCKYCNTWRTLPLRYLVT